MTPIYLAYEKAIARAGHQAGGWTHTYERHFDLSRAKLAGLFKEPIKELPQILFTLRTLRNPTSVPVSLASLQLIQQAVQTCEGRISALVYQTSCIHRQLRALRKMYDLEKIALRVPDGATPFPEDSNSLKEGVEIEFRSVIYWRTPGLLTSEPGTCRSSTPAPTSMPCATSRSS